MASSPTDTFVANVTDKSQVHIDTSLQIELQKSHNNANPVRAALSKYVFSSTSTYARKEFKRGWLQDLALIYKLCDRCKSVPELYDQVQSATNHPMAQRRRSRCLDAIFAFLSTLDSQKTTLEVALTRLRAHLGEAILGAYVKWDRTVTHQYDGTGCARSSERPSRASNGAIDVTVRECKQNKIQCSVHSFFDRNRDSFQKISDSVSPDSSKELQDTKRIIASAMQNSTVLCDSGKCSGMSEALIAVDGLQSSHFAANNDKEWVTISNALGKPLINPVSAHKASR